MIKPLITAVPRSGTAFTAKLLNKSGIRAIHERSSGEVTVSWMHIAHKLNKRYTRDMGSSPAWDHLEIAKKVGVDFNPILHQVRDPLKCIASLTSLRDPAKEFIFKITQRCPRRPKMMSNLDYEIYKCMWCWLKWSELIESRKPSYRFRIEDMEKEYSTVLSILDVGRSGVFPGLARDTNSRSHVTLGMEDLIRCGPDIVDTILEKAESYGYDTSYWE